MVDSGPVIYSTPQPIFDALKREFRFTIDLCADPENAKCERYFRRGDSLSQKWEGWDGWAWLNPPYGREISQWVRKAAECGWPIVSILPGRTNAPWFHDHVMRALTIRFVRRKVSFIPNRGSKSGVPSWGAVVAIFAKHEEAPLICTSWDWKAVGDGR